MRQMKLLVGKQYPKFDPDYCNDIWSPDYNSDSYRKLLRATV